MKYLIFILIFTSTIFSCFGQHIEYFYDDAGNRVIRQFILLIKNTKIEEDSTQNEEVRDSLYTEFIGENKITVYPNPTEGKLFIQGNNLENVVLININGQIISQTPIFNNNATVDLSGKPDGVYIVKVYAGGKNKEWKIIKK